MKFDHSSIEALRLDINSALAALGQKHGLKLTAGSCRFGPEACTFKLAIATVVAGSSEVIDSEASALKTHQPFMGVTLEKLTSAFTYQQYAFRVTGYRRSCYRRPFRCIDSRSGKTYMLSPLQVAQGLKLSLDLQYGRGTPRFVSNVQG